MSKKLSFKGQIAMGLEDRIRLQTLTGKTGYQIKEFKIMGQTPGDATSEYIAQIYSKDGQAIGNLVNFTNDALLAVCYTSTTSSGNSVYFETVIFDNQVFNQNIFVQITDVSGGTVPCNYYIELETIALSDVEATQLTLKNLRNIASR